MIGVALATVLAAAPPTFAAFAAGFPALAPPVAKLTDAGPLDRDAAYAYLVLPARPLSSRPGRASLQWLAGFQRDFKPRTPPESLERRLGEEYALSLIAIGRLAGPDQVCLLFRVQVSGTLYAKSRVHAFLFSPAGRLIDALALTDDERVGDGAGSVTDVAVEAGGLRATIRRELASYDVPSLGWIDSYQTRTFALTPGGLAVGPLARESAEGRYEDPTSKEVLVLAGRDAATRVISWAQPGAPAQVLELARSDEQRRELVVRLPGVPKEYVVKVAPDLESLGRQNPDGTRQTFRRTW